MKFIAICLAALSLNAFAANSLDMGTVPASDSLQATLKGILQEQFEQETLDKVAPDDRTVERTSTGAYRVEGSNGTLECQEISPSGGGVSIQIQNFTCKIDMK